jgi:hypothetical protein
VILRSEFGLTESRVLLYPKFVGVPVKMRNVIRASRERCLALEVLGVKIPGGERGPSGANRWYGREPKQSCATIG